MGYDLHITRAEYHFENQGKEISKEEWLAYIESDPELTLFPDNGDCFADWNGESTHAEPWFDWWDGNIYTKNPDRPVIEKMIEIAEALGARVQGDDGEFYPDTGMPTDEPIEIPLPTKGPVGPIHRSLLRTAGRFWFGAGDLRLGDRVKACEGALPATIVGISPLFKPGDRYVSFRFDDGSESAEWAIGGKSIMKKIE